MCEYNPLWILSYRNANTLNHEKGNLIVCFAGGAYNLRPFYWRHFLDDTTLRIIGARLLPTGCSNMRLFKKRQQDDAALIDRDRGNNYDVQPRNIKNAKGQTSSALNKKQKQPKDRYATSKYPFRTSPHEHATIPMIDRIPTAIGYHSDGSEEEWLEEKSKCSRYETTEDGAGDEDDLREETEFSDDEEQGDDKYSLGRHSQADGIERLWSDDSFDSKPRQQTWDQYDEKQKVESYYKADDMSYLVEFKNDPIYESPRNSPCKEPIVIAPDLRAQSVAPRESATQKHGNKDTKDENKEKSSPVEATDPTQEFVSVPESDSKHESLTEHRASKEQRAEQYVPTKPSGSDLNVNSDASKELDAIMSNESSAHDPAETLAATDVLVKEIEAKLKALKATTAKEKRAIKKLQRESKRSQSRGRNVEREKRAPEELRSKSKPKKPSPTGEERITVAETTKQSLLNGFTVMLFRKTDKNKRATNEKRTPSMPKEDPEPPMLEGKLTRHQPSNHDTESGEIVQLQAAESTDAEQTSKTPSKSKSGFWDFRLRSIFAEKSKANLDDLQHPVSPTLSDPPEHDEYSVDDLPSQTPKAPAVARCLKFYACAGVAENVGEAMKAADRYRDVGIALCGSPTYSTEPMATTPKPTVEVVLEDIDRPEDLTDDPQQMPEKVTRRGFFGQKSTASLTDHTPEAPVWVSSKGQPKILNVTGMKLHLDGDSDPEFDKEELRGSLVKEVKDTSEDNVSHGSSSRVSVTSIKIPKKTKIRVEVPQKRSRLPRFFARLSKKRQA